MPINKNNKTLLMRIQTDLADLKNNIQNKIQDV